MTTRAELSKRVEFERNRADNFKRIWEELSKLHATMRSENRSTIERLEVTLREVTEERDALQASLVEAEERLERLSANLCSDCRFSCES